MKPTAPSVDRIRAFLRRHAATLALAAVALGAASFLGHGAGEPSAADWEAAAAQGGWSTATPLPMPVGGGTGSARTVAALPDAYRHIVPASAAAPAAIPPSELWPAQ